MPTALPLLSWGHIAQLSHSSHFCTENTAVSEACSSQRRSWAQQREPQTVLLPSLLLPALFLHLRVLMRDQGCNSSLSITKPRGQGLHDQTHFPLLQQPCLSSLLSFLHPCHPRVLTPLSIQLTSPVSSDGKEDAARCALPWADPPRPLNSGPNGKP